VFVDQAEIVVEAGKGGDGCVSFFRAAKMPKGGPDGGDGGDGGSVLFETDPGLNTLSDFRGHHHWSAESGEPGRGKQQHGKNGKDITIRVPEGTLLYDHKTGELLADLGPGGRRVVVRGGRGGFGNEHFKSSTNQAPRNFTPGGAGERLELRLELKLIADVGLVGLPNAGKSTLLKVLTRADPKVADYPFTTLSPQLGIAPLDPARRLVIADIPGLIEGASSGAGLGHEFLRHIERTKTILHVLDLAPLDGSDPALNYQMIRAELLGYSAMLADKPEVLALNKLDLVPESDRAPLVRRLMASLQLGARTPVVSISGATGIGLHELLEALWNNANPKGAAPEGWSAPIHSNR
jgi:GTPase